MESQVKRQAWFEQRENPARSERLFIKHSALGRCAGNILYVHPFAEELNKTRRMAHLQAEQLAAAGFNVYQIDLYGCGDSSGDFGDASWALWLDDIRFAFEQMTRAAPTDSAMWLWGTRLGCVLAAAAAQSITEPVNFLFWQPLLSGQAQIQQLLRLVSAGELLSAKPSSQVAALRDRLTKRQAVTIAGYALSAELIDGMGSAKLAPPSGKVGRVVWLDISNSIGSPSAAAAPSRQGDEWRSAGATVTYQQVQGPAFWQTVEMEDAPQLIDATLAALRSDRPADAAAA